MGLQFVCMSITMDQQVINHVVAVSTVFGALIARTMSEKRKLRLEQQAFAETGDLGYSTKLNGQKPVGPEPERDVFDPVLVDCGFTLSTSEIGTAIAGRDRKRLQMMIYVRYLMQYMVNTRPVEIYS